VPLQILSTTSAFFSLLQFPSPPSSAMPNSANDQCHVPWAEKKDGREWTSLGQKKYLESKLEEYIIATDAGTRP